jgi:hypothetical protein
LAEVDQLSFLTRRAEKGLADVNKCQTFVLWTSECHLTKKQRDSSQEVEPE